MSKVGGDEAAVAWRGVSKRFPDGHLALDRVSLDVRRGECLAILGTSGSGKTTLLKTVNRLVEPTDGVVEVLGRPASDWTTIELRRSIGYVIQESGLLPHLDALANVGLVPRLQGRPRREWGPIAEERLAQVGLEPARFARLRPHQLSGGQRQRVGVARALAADPPLILMDEPFGALDPITRRHIQDEFNHLRRSLGKTVVLVTHDVREAFRIADRLALMDAGRLVQHGRPDEVLEAPADAFVEAFLDEARAVHLRDGAAP
jgi:osmoprotectant transport system ATP-binding protein